MAVAHQNLKPSYSECIRTCRFSLLQWWMLNGVATMLLQVSRQSKRRDFSMYLYVEPTVIQLCMQQDSCFFLFHTLSHPRWFWQENSCPFDSIFATTFGDWPWLYIPLSNLLGSKVQVVNKLGWLVQIRSWCARSRSPKMCSYLVQCTD